MIQKGSKWSKKGSKYPNYNFGPFGFLLCDKIELYLPPFRFNSSLRKTSFVYKEKKSLKWIFGALNDVNGISKKGNIVR